MQRPHSLTSISTAQFTQTLPQSRFKGADLSTDSVIPDNPVFSRKCRKHDLPASKASTYNFSNGEVFTPRLVPSKRTRPSKLSVDAHAPLNYPPKLLRSASMVLLRAVPIHDQTYTPQRPAVGPRPSASTSGSYRNRSYSFNNMRQKSKRELAQSLRNTKLDTPTNICLPQFVSSGSPFAGNISSMHPMPGQYRLLSLTNNRYSENATNIVLLKHASFSAPFIDSATAGAEHMTRLDSAPSSISNTPQTSVSGSDSALEYGLKSWSSAESVSSFRTAQDPSPLSSIEEAVQFQADHVNSGCQTVYGKAPDSCLSSHASFEDPPTIQPHNQSYHHDTNEDLEECQVPVDEPTRSDLSDSGASRNEPSAESLYLSTSSLSSRRLAELSVREAQLGDMERAVEPQVPSNNMTLSSTASDSVFTLRTLVLADGKAVCVGNSPQSPEFSELHELGSYAGESPRDHSDVKDLKAKSTDLHGEDEVEEKERVVYLAVADESSQCSSGKDGCGQGSVINTLGQEDSRSKTIVGDIQGILENGVSHVNGSGTQEKTETSPGETTLHLENMEKKQQAHDIALNLTDKDSGTSDRPIESNIKPPVASSLLDKRKVDMLPIMIPFSSSAALKSSCDVLIRSFKLDTVLSDLPGRLSEERKSDINTTPYGDRKESGSPEEPFTDATNVTDESENCGYRGPGDDQIELYSPIHVDRYLADDQEAVPPRGDLAVKNGAIEFHTQEGFAIGSELASPNLSLSPGSQRSLYIHSPKVAKLVDILDLPPGSKFASPVTGNAMLAIVDVDYDFDKLYPLTPKRDFFSKRIPEEARLEEESRAEASESPKRHQRVADTGDAIKSSSPESNMKGFKKIFKFMKFSFTRVDEAAAKPREGSSRSILRRFTSVGRAVEKPDERRTSLSSSRRNSKSNPSTLDNPKLDCPKPSGTRKREFLSSLKLTTGFKVYDLLSPKYSDRERELSPDESSVTLKEEEEKFDLPEYSVESDYFSDVLLRFKEVENQIENEVQDLRKTKKVHDFFLKDHELSKSQIADQQNKDKHVSDEFLPGKTESQDASAVNLQPVEGEHDAIGTDALGQRLAEQLAEFPQNNEKRSIVLDTAQMQIAFAQSRATRRSYLKFLRQFSDFGEIKIELSGFDPAQKADIGASTELTVSSLSKGSSKVPRKVKFANTISISETYAPCIYKRYNKSVTQYYLTEYSEINRIKNELNAYKCYEMLVHEKSKANTHFFY